MLGEGFAIICTLYIQYVYSAQRFTAPFENDANINNRIWHIQGRTFVLFNVVFFTRIRVAEPKRFYSNWLSGSVGCSDLVLFFDFTIWAPFMI